jgi:hypothetical protein
VARGCVPPVCQKLLTASDIFSADCRSVYHAIGPIHLGLVRACCVLNFPFLTPSVILKRKATPSFSPLRPPPGGPPLGRGSDGRFGLRRFRAKPTPTPLALTALSLTPSRVGAGTAGKCAL